MLPPVFETRMKKGNVVLWYVVRMADGGCVYVHNSPGSKQPPINGSCLLPTLANHPNPQHRRTGAEQPRGGQCRWGILLAFCWHDDDALSFFIGGDSRAGLRGEVLVADRERGHTGTVAPAELPAHDHGEIAVPGAWRVVHVQGQRLARAKGPVG